MRYLVGLAVALCLGGCAAAPLEETRAFVSAVNTVKSTSDLLWDELNVAERNQHLRIIARRSPGARFQFRLEDAYYFSNIAESPDTAQFRRALLIVHDYSELLRTLVEGTNVQAARGQIEALVMSVSILAGSPGISLAVAQLRGVLDKLIQTANLAEARRLVVEGEPAIRELIFSLKQAAPSIFSTLTADLRISGGADAPRRLSLQRTVVANFVVMLDRLDQNFVRLVRAFEQPSNPVTLAALVQATAELNADIKSAREALARLRSGT
jgi:hypothetical protein